MITNDLFQHPLINAKIDISININERLLFDKEIKFLKILSDFYNAQRQFTQGEGKRIQMENIQRLINSKMMNIEIEENKQELPDEDWINQGIMTPKVKAVYYKIRELFEKNCEEYFEFFERPEGDMDTETKTNGKIIMTFDFSGRPCELQTPNGTYKSLHMTSFNEENLDNFINEVKNTYELKMTTGGYKIEVDY